MVYIVFKTALENERDSVTTLWNYIDNHASGSGDNLLSLKRP
jgi:hypothetical protein